MTAPMRHAVLQAFIRGLRCAAAALICIPLLLLSPRTAAAGDERIVLGVHPFLPPQQLQEVFSPLVRVLTQRTGIPVSLAIARNYDEHIRTIGEGKVDIAFVGPVSYVLLVRRYGEHPLLAHLEIRGKPFFTGVIFVTQTSAIHRLQDLRGKRFAFGERESTMGHIVPLFLLERAGVSMDTLSSHENLSDHANIALAVLSGDFDAGAVKDDVFERFRPRGLRALAVSPQVPEHVFVSRRGLAGDRIARIRKVLLDLGNDPVGARVLRAIRSDATGLVAAADRDYDGLRMILDAVAPEGRLP